MRNKIKLWAMAAFLMFAFSNGVNAITLNVNAATHSINNGLNLVGLNTGIVVTPGKLLVINADRQDTWAGSLANIPINANGAGNPFGGVTPTNFTLPGTNFSFLFGSLVGSLDNGRTFFPVGTRLEKTILTAGSGTLRLYFWDVNNFDNSGSVAVNIQVYNGPN